MGELGTLSIRDVPGGCHIVSAVTGDPDDPLTEKRRQIFEPLAKKLSDAVDAQIKAPSIAVPENLTPPRKEEHIVPAQILTCATCEAYVAHLIFAERANTGAEFEDMYRLMFPRMKELNLPTWILGPELRDGMMQAMQAWPEKAPRPHRESVQKFDALMQELQNCHCRPKA
jgi:hypothetical protein